MKRNFQLKEKTIYSDFFSKNLTLN